MKNVSSRQTVAPVSFRCKLSTLVPYLRQLSDQRQASVMQPRLLAIRLAS